MRDRKGAKTKQETILIGLKVEVQQPCEFWYEGMKADKADSAA